MREHLSHSEVSAIVEVKGGLVQVAPLIERLMNKEYLARWEAYAVVHRLQREGYFEEEMAEKRQRSGRLKRVKILVLTDKARKLFKSSV